MSEKITGSLINAFYICPRKAWLVAHEFGPEPDNVYIEIGKLIAGEAYKRERKEIVFENIKIDLVKTGNKGTTVVGEVKKSSKGQRSATMQLSFYLYRLKQRGINVKGELLIPKEKKKISVELTPDIEDELKQTFHHIKEIINQDNPPEPVKNKYCSNCAYKEFCWV
ncbi:CRISPR-associated protein Cas4 [Candidatus Aerophobetes bacterium]|nr:CRISPR-associated protein Cas4 [Candidatus Aerophobetes bacterium]